MCQWVWQEKVDRLSSERGAACCIRTQTSLIDGLGLCAAPIGRCITDPGRRLVNLAQPETGQPRHSAHGRWPLGLLACAGMSNAGRAQYMDVPAQCQGDQPYLNYRATTLWMMR